MNIRKQQRREDALARQANHDLLTVEQKIAKAESRGGSVRELARLRRELKK